MSLRDMIVSIDFDDINVSNLLNVDSAMNQIESGFDRMGSNINTTGRDFNRLGSQAGGAMNEIGSEAGNAGDAINEIGSEANSAGNDITRSMSEAEGAMQGINQAGGQASNTLDQVGDAGRNLGQDVTTGANDADSALNGLNSGAGNTESALNEMGDAGQQAGNDVTSGAGNAEGALNNIQSGAGNVEGALNQLGDAGQRSGDDIVNGAGDADSALNDITNGAGNAENGLNNLGDAGQRAGDQAAGGADEAGDAANNAGDAANEASGGFETLGGVGAKAGAAIAAGFAAAYAAVVLTVSETETAFDRLQAKTKTTGTQFEGLKTVSKDVFTGAFGESIGQVTDDVAVLNSMFGDLNDEQLTTLAEGAYTIGDLWGPEVKEVGKTVKTMTKTFDGLSETKAMDLMTTAFQKTGDYSDDLLDTFNEYSVYFQKMGFDAEGFTNLLVKGADAGAFTIDKAGDAIKEFGIRSIDASDATADGFKAIGLDAGLMTKNFATGGDTAQQAFAATIAGLSNMKDPIAQNAAGVALFGTQWEDLRETVILSMSDGKDALGDFEGATEQAAATAYDNFGSKMTGMWRTLKIGVAEAFMDNGGEEMLNGIADSANDLVPKIESMVESAVDFANTIKDNWGPIKETIIGVTVAVGSFAVMMGGLSVIGTVRKAMALWAVGNKIAALSMLGLNGAMLLSPITWIVVGIAAVIAIGVLLYRNWDTVKAKALELWGAMKVAWSNIVSATSSAWDSVSTAVGNGIDTAVSWVTEKAGAIGDYLSGVWESIATGASLAWSFIVTGITMYFTAALAVITGIGSSIASFFSNLWAGIVSTVSSVLGTIVGVFSAIGSGIMSAVSTIWGGIVHVAVTIFNNMANALMGPLTFVGEVIYVALKLMAIGAITILNGLLAGFALIWNTLYDVTMSVFTTLQTGVLTVANFLWTGLVTIFSAISATVTPIFTSITTAIVTAFGIAKAFVMTGAMAIWTTVSSAFNLVLSVAISVFGAVRNAVSSAFSAALAIVTSVAMTIYSVISSYFSMALGIASSIFNSIRSVVSGAITGASSAVSSAASAIYNAIMSRFNSARAAAASAFNALRSAVTSAISGAASFVSTTASNIYSSIKSRFDSAKSTTTSSWNGIKSSISTAMSSAKTSVSNFFSPLMSFISSAKSAWDGLVGKLKNFKMPSIKMPSLSGLSNLLPGHATGLARVPYDDYAARLHKDEAVLTASQAGALRQAGILGSAGGTKPTLELGAALPASGAEMPGKIEVPTSDNNARFGQLSGEPSPIVSGSKNEQTTHVNTFAPQITIQVEGGNDGQYDKAEIAEAVKKEIEKFWIQMNLQDA